MIVLHAGSSDSQLLLWGEMPVELGTRARKQGGRKPSEPLPYDAGTEGLSAALLMAGFDFTAGKQGTEAGIIWLPTVDNQPVASSSLIAELPQSRARTMLTPWAVTLFFSNVL